jgi:hypothetical protein
MLFTQAAKLKQWFCSGDKRPFLATPKLLFPCSFVIGKVSISYKLRLVSPIVLDIINEMDSNFF